MTVYLVMFACSLCLFHEAQRLKGNRGVSVGMNICAILLPALVAGLRDYSIGTDVLAYGNIWFERAVQSDSVLEYCSFAIRCGIGLFYALFNYIVSRFSSNPHTFYFFYALAEVVIVFGAAKKNADIINVPFAMAVYYFIFYNTTLNMLRQSMSMVILLYGFYYIRKKQTIQYMIAVIFAVLFHSSAVIGVAFYIIHVLINHGKIKKRMTIILCGFAAFFFAEIAEIFVRYMPYGWKYAHYLSEFNNEGSGWGRILFLFAPIVLLFCFFTKKVDSLGIEFEDLKMYAVCSLLFSIIGLQFRYAIRIVYYFDTLLIFIMPFLAKHLRIRLIAGKTDCTSLFFLMYLIASWIYKFGFKGSSETVPYVMMNLGF